MSYGCFNRPPLRDMVEVPCGYWPRTRDPVMGTVPFQNTRDCQYTLSELGKTDAGCVDCIHKRTE